jgi:hypothetical protein
MSDDFTRDATATCFLPETDSVMCELDLTRMAVQVAYRHSKSWRVLAAEKGVSHNVLYALAHGEWSKVSWETHRMVRRKFGLPDPGPLAYVTPCPTCGGVHIAGDCHGREVATVVTLAPGEVVVKQAARKAGKPRKADGRGTLHVEKSLIAEINARRGDMTQAAYIKHLMEAR